MRQEIRSSDVFLKTDIAGMLNAILATTERLAVQFPDDPGVQAYRAGFAAAVAAVATAIAADHLVQSPYQRGGVQQRSAAEWLVRP